MYVRHASSASAECARGPRRPRAPDLSCVRPSGRIRVRGRCASTARGRRNGSFAACRGRCATAERVLEHWCVFRSATLRSWRRTEIRRRGGIRSTSCPRRGGSLHGYERRMRANMTRTNARVPARPGHRVLPQRRVSRCVRSRSPTGRRNGAIGRDVSCTFGTPRPPPPSALAAHGAHERPI